MSVLVVLRVVCDLGILTWGVTDEVSWCHMFSFTHFWLVVFFLTRFTPHKTENSWEEQIHQYFLDSFLFFIFFFWLFQIDFKLVKIVWVYLTLHLIATIFTAWESNWYVTNKL